MTARRTWAATVARARREAAVSAAGRAVEQRPPGPRRRCPPSGCWPPRRLAEEIERVVVFGHPTLSRPVSRLLARDDVELVVVSAYAGLDRPRAARRPRWSTRSASPSRRIATGLAPGQADDAELRRRLDDLLAGAAVLQRARIWPRGCGLPSTQRDTLFVGSSNPIRDLDLAPISAAPPTVYANRGLAGIDGSISTAAGIALAARAPDPRAAR